MPWLWSPYKYSRLRSIPTSIGHGMPDQPLKELDEAGDRLFEPFTGHDQVDHAMFQKELRALKLLRELLLDGLFNDSWAGEPDESLGFGQDDVAQHRKAGRHAPEGRIGQDGNVRDARRGEATDGGRR